MFPEPTSPASPEAQRAARARAANKLINVVTVIGLFVTSLLVIVLLRISSPGGESGVTRAQVQIKSIEVAVEMFQIDAGRYPASLQDLIQAPTGTTNWHGPYLKLEEISRDPWGNDYIYQYPGTHTNLGVAFDLCSTGPDGKSIIPNWTLPTHPKINTP